MAGSKTDVNRSAKKRPWILRWGFLALPIGVVWGVILGAVIGGVLGNLAIGAAIGAALGVGLGLALFAAAVVAFASQGY